MALDLTCPSTSQLLRRISLVLVRASLATISKLLSLSLVPLGLNKVVSFEFVCRDLNSVPTVTLFRVFQCLCKQGDWFSFSKRRNTEDVCMDDGPSSLKKWKKKNFLIDCKAIPDHLTWRHSCSCVSDDLYSDGYDQNDVQRLCARLIHLHEMREEVLVGSGLKMSIYDFMTLPSWSDAKISEESHHLSLALLERVSSHTTAPATKGAIILLPTTNEIVASLPYSCLIKKSKELDQAEGTDEADLADLCAKIEDSLDRDEGVYMRAILALTPRLSKRLASAPIPRLGKRLGAPPSMAVVSASEPSHVGTSAHASISGRSLSLGGMIGHAGKSEAEVVRRQVDPLDSLARSALARDVEYDQIPRMNIGTALDLDVCRKALDRTITPAKLRRTESLLPLELSIVCPSQEKLDKKKGIWHPHLTDAKSTSASLSEELTQTDAKLSEQALTVRDLQNELVLEKFKSQEYKDVAGGLREEVTQFVGFGVESLVRKLLSSDEFHAALARVASLGINYCADFDKALDDFPTTLFPFLSKIDAASKGSLSDVAQILPKKFVRSATLVAAAPSSANEAPERVPP
ncbi:hypothetical protein Tco_0983767 [Tanacetum coccineum]